jgi:hypothetical protein
MSTVVKDLGAVSAYAYAVEKGYTGTEAEFAELMADYAEVGQRAEDAADSALESKTAAQTAATTATNKASEATTKAAEAQADADAAALDASQALSAASTATTKATEATTAAATAVSAKDDAVAANTAAQSAKTAAQTAQTGAETAAASVEASAAQIATNAADISQLKSEFTALESDGVVPSAEQILSDKGITDSVPYHYRKTGGDGADRLYDQIVGGTINWNQLIVDGNFTDPTKWDAQRNWSTLTLSNGVATVTYESGDKGVDNPAIQQPTDMRALSVTGHKYIVSIDMKASGSNIGAPYFRTNVFNPQSRGSNLTSNWQNIAFIFNATGANHIIFYIGCSGYANVEVGDSLSYRNFMCVDLTTMFGTTIADYIYQLEQTTAGAGVALFKSLFPKDYYPYNSGELVSVSGLSAHVMRDADDNIIRSYPLDSTLTLRGVPKLVDGKMCFDGDTYDADGTVTHNTILRAYQSGDESLANAITDGTNTVVYSANASTEQADPYQHLQQCDPSGTEEYVSTGIVPIGHNSFYPENLRAKVEGLPWNFANLIAPTESTFTATRNYTTGALFIVSNVLYKATSNIANGGTITPNTNCTATTLAEIISALA